MDVCPECGAPEGACETRFNECLVKEFEEAGYGAVHHLTVTAYMLQHSSKLTKEGWLHMRQLMRDFSVKNKPPDLVRQQNRDKVDSGKRDWKIAADDGQPKIDRQQWAKTIMDVRLDDAKTYCADVTDWAKAVLADAEQTGIKEKP
jgi:hypothetical protein